MTAIQTEDWGLLSYREAYERQMAAVKAVLQGGAERLILCEHPAVLTLGRLADRGHILARDEELARRGVDVIPVNRGGEVTLHAPGQLVVYPILNLQNRKKDLRLYLWKLEHAAIDFLKDFAILADRISGNTGVWSGSRKIVSIGVGVKSWVTFHGLGINVNTDLSFFQLIRPCGLDVRMTSIADLTGRAVVMAEAKERFIAAFNRIFGGPSGSVVSGGAS